MTARQSVLIAIFLSLIVFLLSQASPAAVEARANSLKQTPPLGGGSSGGGGGGAGGGF